MGMTIDALAKKTGMQIIVRGRAGKTEIDHVHASDRMSDLLGQVSDSTLLITNLTNSSIVRMVELMDVPAVCLLNGVEPVSPLVEAAKEHRTALLVSPAGMFETCGRLYKALEV
jgi:serine kinase of HPr protein (carbohydrate metabolism regulator)